VKSVCNRKRNISLYVYEIRNYHGGVPEDSGLLRCEGFSLNGEPLRSSEDNGIMTMASSGNTQPKTQLQIAEDMSLLLLTSLGFMQQNKGQ